jgi:hypothetical protein
VSITRKRTWDVSDGYQMKGRLVIEHLGGVVDLSVTWPNVYPSDQATGATDLANLLTRMLGTYVAKDEEPS